MQAPIVDKHNLTQDWKNTRLFNGTYGGFQRMDVQRFPQLYNITRMHMGTFWVPEEINLSNDKINFPNLPPHHQEAFRINLLFQTFADSVQSRGIEFVLREHCTDPSVEPMFGVWSFFETIHSMAYSHIVREMFPGSEATKFFDAIDQYPDIKERFTTELEAYSQDTPDIPYLIMRIFALESLKFFVSFAVTYAINAEHENAIQGTARIIRLIQHDEHIHTAMSARLLRIGLENPTELGVKSSEGWEARLRQIFAETYDNEMAWYDYLSNYIHDIPRLARAQVEDFLKHRINTSLMMVGFEPMFNVEKNDLTNWFYDYSDINTQHTALQEAENLSYEVGGLENDL